MEIDGFHAAAPNLCNVCIDTVQGGESAGRLYHYYRPEPERFRNQYELIEEIETLCDWLNYPQAAERHRSFSSLPQPIQSPKETKVERCMSKEKLMEPKGEKATFVVHVMYRQNATWQGSVTWAEKKQTANFRSALELIKLMDSAVEATSIGDDEPPAPPEEEKPKRQTRARQPKEPKE